MSDYGNEPERYPWEQWHPAGHARRRIAGFGDVCVADDQEWPCDTVRAAVPSPVPAGTERAVLARRVIAEHTFEAGYGGGKGELVRHPPRCSCGAQLTGDGYVVHVIDTALAAAVASYPATPEGGRGALQERIDAALALCHRADYGGDDWPYPDHYVPASRIRDALTDIDPTPSPASPAETREGQAMTEQANLGLATTGELLDELRARIEVDHASGSGGLDYTTIGGRPASPAVSLPGEQPGGEGR